jgi:hypothetical protein
VTGLPFHVNADFLLSASRESYQRDHLWNQLLEKNFVSHVHHAASALAKVMLVDPLRLVPLPTAKWLRAEMVETLKQVPIVPVWRREERAKGPECCTIPEELMALDAWKELPNSLPRIVDLESHKQQREILGVVPANKGILETIIRIQLVGRSADPKWYCQLYACMAKAFKDWTPNNTSVIPNFILCEDNSQAPLDPNSEKYIWPPTKSGSLKTLHKYCSSKLLVNKKALPTKGPFDSVCEWFSHWNVRKVKESIAIDLCIQFVNQASTHSEVLEGTKAILACEKKATGSIPELSLAFACADGTIQRPPFRLPIVRNSKLLELYNTADKSHFHILSEEYPTGKLYHSILTRIFKVNELPLPQIFSWMHSWKTTEFTEQKAELLLLLLHTTPTKPIPGGIRNFLNTKPWVPTTTGIRVASQAYFPTPEIHEIFGSTVPFVISSFYKNGNYFQSTRAYF